MIAVRAGVLLQLWQAAQSLECGTWITNDCLGAKDIRYDKDYPTGFIEQDVRWKKWEGFWAAELTSYGEDGKIVEPAIPDASNPYGFPYKSENYKGYYNNTFVGSRFIFNRYTMHPPPDASWCNALPVDAVSSYSQGGGVCGVNGFSFAEGGYGVTSYEKNGELNMLKGYGKLQEVLGPFRWVDDETLMANVGNPDAMYGAMDVLVWLNEADTVAAGSLSRFFLGDNAGLAGTVTITLNKLTEAQFIQGVKDTYSDLGVLPADQVQGGTFPMETLSLVDGSYPSEEEWCTIDPECSESPYQEPAATLKAGIIAAFITVASVLIIIALIAFFLWRLKQQRHRYRNMFMKRIAENIHLEGHLDCMTEDQLAEEFKRIDTGAKGGDGYLEKEELKEFMQSGKAGKLSNNDFNAMWVALDFDHSGKVDFIEFCTFLSRCGQEYDEVEGLQKGLTRKDKTSHAAGLISRKGHHQQAVEGAV